MEPSNRGALSDIITHKTKTQRYPASPPLPQPVTWRPLLCHEALHKSRPERRMALTMVKTRTFLHSDECYLHYICSSWFSIKMLQCCCGAWRYNTSYLCIQLRYWMQKNISTKYWKEKLRAERHGDSIQYRSSCCPPHVLFTASLYDELDEKTAFVQPCLKLRLSLDSVFWTLLILFNK